jgi:hypothetical protein
MKKISILFLLACSAMAAMAQDSKTQALEAGAMGVMRTIHTAEVTYSSYYNKFACSLEPMMSGPQGAKPSAEHAGLIDNSVKDEKRRMYRFEVHCVGKGKPGTEYKSSAEPLIKGARAFCSDESGAIRYSADGNAKTCMAKGEVLQ